MRKINSDELKRMAKKSLNSQELKAISGMGSCDGGGGGGGLPYPLTYKRDVKPAEQDCNQHV